MISFLNGLNPLLTWRPSKKDLAEIMLIASALPLYYLVRGFAHERVGEAMARSVDIARIERSLGIFWEADLQRKILDYHWLVDFLNGFYLYGHLPVIGALALWLYFWHRPQYLLMRNAFLLSGAIGLIIYVSFPVAPPRFLPEFGFVDTVLNEYKTGRPLTPAFFVNEYAAMPSLHFGWNLLVGAAVWLSSKRIILRAFAVAMPFMMFTDIILTANHYFLDAAAGMLVVLLGALIAYNIRRMVLRRQGGEQSTLRDCGGWRGWLGWLCGVPEGETAIRSRGGSAA